MLRGEHFVARESLRGKTRAVRSDAFARLTEREERCNKKKKPSFWMVFLLVHLQGLEPGTH